MKGFARTTSATAPAAIMGSTGPGRRAWRRLSRQLAVLMMALGLVLGSAVAAHAASPYYTAVFTLTKNSSSPENSSLTFVVRRVVDGGTSTVVVNVTVRAGSGEGSTNGCIQNQGWLPNGRYHIQEAFSNHQGIITGHAFYLNDTKCSDGTLRSALFIHSSYPWDPSRYFSDGCIKVNNTHINTLYNDFSTYFPVNSFHATNTPTFGHEATGGIAHVLLVVQT